MSIYTVTQLNQEMKLLLETHPNFRNVFVRGEISNFKLHTSGHCYFSLKDRDAAISCVMFRSDAQRLRFRPENGLSVIVRGRISAYPKTGQVQLYAADLVPDGAGALSLQFEQLKEKLYREGLFDPSHKKELPLYPNTIAIVTSPTGAAVHDMIRILRRRFPCAEVLIYPALVQGADAPASLMRALLRADRDARADVLIVGRGGGSVEDLWAFNDETLARTIYAMKTPVVSAVGHEPDVTIADFVADVRAATPSAAAELVTPDCDELRQIIDSDCERSALALRRMLEKQKERLSRAQRALSVHTPERQIAELRRA
ncbi:MAG: exodeoxyribonuclease VII large subunit, partial [Butyricicoccus sp.]